MLKLGCEVTIESDPARSKQEQVKLQEEKKVTQKWVFNALSSCTIVEDTGSLTDTCVIELPKKISWQQDPRPRDQTKAASEVPVEVPIKRGDRITVKLGYDDHLKVRFSGYIRNVNTKAPIRIECEDEMFLLKLLTAKKRGFPGIKLKELVGFLLEGTGVEYKLLDNNIALGPYRITRSTVAEELNELKRERGLKAYFIQSVLHVGYDYPFDGRNKESFIHSKNIINEELDYRREEDIKLKIKATSIDRKNVRSELELGDKDGEEVQVFINNVDRNELKVFAQKAYDRYKYTGHRGSFETFGEPAMHKCDTAHLEPSDGKQGDYLVKKVEINFGTNGYRQKIDLGPVLKTEQKK